MMATTAARYRVLMAGALLLESLGTDDVLWQRQMALGPGEFCLHTVERISVPEGIDARVIPLRAVFPASV